jgi:hypothetical protein
VVRRVVRVGVRGKIRVRVRVIVRVRVRVGVNTSLKDPVEARAALEARRPHLGYKGKRYYLESI